MSEKERDQVEDPHSHEDIQTARSLPEMANAENSLAGYAAMNAVPEDSDIAKKAQEMGAERAEPAEAGARDDEDVRSGNDEEPNQRAQQKQGR